MLAIWERAREREKIFPHEIEADALQGWGPVCTFMTVYLYYTLCVSVPRRPGLLKAAFEEWRYAARRAAMETALRYDSVNKNLILHASENFVSDDNIILSVRACCCE